MLRNHGTGYDALTMFTPRGISLVPEDRRPAGDLGTVARVLREGRSCVIEVVNQTEHVLTVTDVTPLHGAFATHPRPRIGPRECDVFGAQNLPKALGVGCEGAVTYGVAEGLTVTLYFDNPFAGRNFAGAQFSGRRASEYTCESAAGTGDQLVRMRFVIRREPNNSARGAERRGLPTEVQHHQGRQQRERRLPAHRKPGNGHADGDV
jgi:hypothetical protein